MQLKKNFQNFWSDLSILQGSSFCWTFGMNYGPVFNPSSFWTFQVMSVHFVPRDLSCEQRSGSWHIQHLDHSLSEWNLGSRNWKVDHWTLVTPWLRCRLGPLKSPMVSWTIEIRVFNGPFSTRGEGLNIWFQQLKSRSISNFKKQRFWNLTGHFWNCIRIYIFFFNLQTI